MGKTVLDVKDAEQLRESAVAYDDLRAEAEELAYWTLYRNGRKGEMRPERLARLAHRCRTALVQDPLAGAEADLLANFGFGKGVGVPGAEDEDVQQVIREAWTDGVNEQKLTSFAAQRLRSNQLLTDSNLFVVAYRGKGRVKIGFIDPDRVVDIVTDPDDEERPLYYVVEDRAGAEWDFENDMPKAGSMMGPGIPTNPTGGAIPVTYWPHWRNVEDVDIERRDAGLPPLEKPDPRKTAKGVVEHFAWNRVGNALMGTPVWARTLRFYSAMNMLLESHVAMAEAASSFIAKQGLTGSPDQITRSANNILSQTGEIGAARFGGGPDPDAAFDLGGGRVGRPGPAPGSFLQENESSKLESLSLNSGAGQMMQTAQIVRAPIAAASGFGQNYLGDPSSTNLAGATSLELPTMMTVQAWQQFFVGVFSWFVDIVLETAIRAGRLNDAVDRAKKDAEDQDPEDWDQDGDGVPDREQDNRPLTELRLREADDRKELEARTGKLFDYTISMPYPGRRNLPDVVTTVTTVKQAFDPESKNVPLMRGMLLFLAKEMNLDDPVAAVDEWMPEEAGDMIARAALAQVQGQVDGQDQDAAQRAAQQAGGVGPDGQPLMPGAPQPVAGGDPSQGSGMKGDVPKNAQGIFEGILEGLDGETAVVWREQVMDPLLASLDKRPAPPES
jgi:hypothetical protein